MLPLTLDRVAVADDSGGTAAISAEPEVLSLWIPTQPVSERNSCMEVAKNCPLETTALYDGPPPLLPLTSIPASSLTQRRGILQAGRTQ